MDAMSQTVAMDKKAVFVIHGRNSAARLAMFEFLRSIELHPLEWARIVAATGHASPYIGDVLEKGFSMAQAAVALLTPDDVARLGKAFQGDNEPSHETMLTGQPRQNVLFEAGMAMGKFPERTVLVELGKLRPMSDTHGRHVVRLTNAVDRRQDLATRLQTAGCDVSLVGTDWHQSGDFERCISTADESENELAGEFLEYWEGLSGDELYRLAKAVNNGSQTLLDCGPNDPVTKVMVHKGFLEPVAVRQSMEEMRRRASVPHIILTHVWRFLNANKASLFDRAIWTNQERNDRMPNLREWRQRHVPDSA
jgi:predicted nucleotide-binding protein